MRRFNRPLIKSYNSDELYQIIGPAQASYSIDIWLQQISRDVANLSSKSGKTQMIAKMPEQKIYRYSIKLKNKVGDNV